MPKCGQVSALAALTALEELSLARNRLGSACTFGIAGAAAAAAALASDSGQGPGSMALSCDVGLPGAGAAILPALTRLCLADNSLASLPALQLRSLTRARTPPGRECFLLGSSNALASTCLRVCLAGYAWRQVPTHC